MLSIVRTLLMRRIFIIVFLLAAVSAISANGSPVSPAKAHRRASATTSAHRAASPKKSQHKSIRAAGHAGGRASGYKAGYRMGYAAGHSAGMKELAGASRCVGQHPQPLQATARPANKPFQELAPEDNTFTAPAALAEPTSLHLKHAGTPPSLRGSLASLERQNTRLNDEGLERIEDEEDLAGRIAHHLLIPVPASPALSVNENLAARHRFCRPWTARFLADLARAHQVAFRKPLEVSSAVRTVQYQKRLMATNGNAAPAEGDIVSPHLTGAAVDIVKDNLTRQELAWMRRRLLELEKMGKIDVTEEFQQACFHITVYKNYMQTATASKAGLVKAGQHASLRGPAASHIAEPPISEMPATGQIASSGQ